MNANVPILSWDNPVVEKFCLALYDAAMFACQLYSMRYIILEQACAFLLRVRQKTGDRLKHRFSVIEITARREIAHNAELSFPELRVKEEPCNHAALLQ